MAHFDQAARYLIRRAPAAFFAWATPGVPLRWRFLDFADTSTVTFPGEPDRVCDTVAEWARDGEGGEVRLLLDTEAQSEPHPDMLERQGEYLYRLRRELRFGPGRAGKYVVAGVLLTLTGPEQPSDLDMTLAELGGAGARLRLAQRTLRDADAARTLGRVAAGELGRPVLPWIPLMRGAERPGILREWVRVALAEPDGRWRADLGALARIFANLAGRRAWLEALGGWQMKESSVVLEWLDEGEARGLRKVLVRGYRLRFGVDLPAPARDRIDRETDPATLARWHDALFTSENSDGFLALLR